jgi:formylglycine-generating enzyme required for sulfatase activity
MFKEFLNQMGNQTQDGVLWYDSIYWSIQQIDGNWQVFYNREEYPVDANWYGANAYCEWAGRNLPTEAQWEKSARGGLVGKPYPWGDQTPNCVPGSEYGASYGDCFSMPVASFSPNSYGLYDMVGNYLEWVRDWYEPDYYTYTPYENPPGPSKSDKRVLRGGLITNYWHLRTAYRHAAYPNWDYDVSGWTLPFGFRCALAGH